MSSRYRLLAMAIKAPDTENVVRLSAIFGVSTDYLLHDDFTGDEDIPAELLAQAEEYHQKYLDKKHGLIMTTKMESDQILLQYE